MDIQEAKKLLKAGDHLVIDIRDPDSYDQGHIPDAIHLHDGNIEDFVRSTDKQQRILVYCYHGITSVDAVAYLGGRGFKQVESLEGGFERWLESNNDQEDLRTQ